MIDTISTAFRDHLNKKQSGLMPDYFSYIELKQDGDSVQIHITPSPEGLSWYNELKAEWPVK